MSIADEILAKVGAYENYLAAFIDGVRDRLKVPSDLLKQRYQSLMPGGSIWQQPPSKE